jgi:hypothetical protein
MKRIAIVSISATVALLLSLLPVWNFSERIAIVALRTSDGIYLKPKGAPEDKGNFLPPTAQ